MMQKLSAFENVSLDGYFTDANGDFSWAHRQDEEWDEFAGKNAGGGGALLFGRVTYDLMVKYWPTPQAARDNAAVAEGMNRKQKYVVSRTLDQVAWHNTALLKGDLLEEVRGLKNKDGPGLVILGSGSIVAQLAEAGLIDEYQIALLPVVLGTGRTLFDGVRQKFDLKLSQSRSFKNGNLFLRYEKQ